MKKFFLFLLSASGITTHTYPITNTEYSKIFEKYNACFILYSVNEQKILTQYNPKNRCKERISPNSTFKIPLSIMAFDSNVIYQNTIFKWDGKKGFIPEHEQDQTPESWLKYSVLWVSQKITPELGYARIKKYLYKFNYGNQNFSGDLGKNNALTHAWVGSSLKISALEQLYFLNAFLNNKFSVSQNSILYTKKNLYLGKLDNKALYYGKTGSGRHSQNERLKNPSRLRDGWFIGFIEKDNKQYIFISNLTDKFKQPIIERSLKPYGGQIIKLITIQLLNEYFMNERQNN